ncbi:MAG: hypothetical protein RQ982_09225 [Gammaproteobacteria bacterium]|nr:hypothetical protein [Gammaproteobacteria bacterium]
MSIFNYIFGRKNRDEVRDSSDECKPAISGGDGSSRIDAVVINCTNMTTGNELINQFISEKHGEINKDWNRAMEYFVNSSDVPENTIRCVSIERKDETTLSYYFDVSRPMT